MESHQMTFVYAADTVCQRIPYLRLIITADIPSYHPNNIRLILVTFCKKLTVCHGFFFIHQPLFHGSSPNTYHPYIDAPWSGTFNNIVHVIPISINPFAVDIFEIKTVCHGILAVNIHGRHTVQYLHLHHVISGILALIQIVRNLVTIQALRHQPSSFTQPEERYSIFMLQVASLLGHHQFAVLPGNIRFRFLRRQRSRAT